jgi:hypothetical protein
MLLSPRRASTNHQLLQLAAAWLVVVLALQGWAAVVARVAGPQHTHQATHNTAGKVAVAWVHGATAAAHDHHHDNGHNHSSQIQRHHHGAGDTSVVATPGDAQLQDALDAAGAALAAAFALLATSALLRLPTSTSQVWRAAPAWAWQTAHSLPLQRPPQGV